LSGCPESPNCVITEGEKPPTPPLTFNDSPEEAWARAKEAVIDVGGKIESEDNGYLWATFTSAIFHFVDDLELRMDKREKLLHLRSASRVGYFDFGVNKKRYKKIAGLFHSKP